MEKEQLNKELIFLQIAMIKQILEIKELLRSLIKQEEPKVKKEPLYVKYFR